MNFLKGIVDGILAEDADRPNVPGVLQRSFMGDPRLGSDEAGRHTDALSRSLDDVYREERRNCITSLLIRYGEGCVQQLNELLKTNNETIKTMSKHLDDAYRSLGDFNSELESLAHDNVRLRQRNVDLSNELELLHSENAGLRSVIAQAEIETKSQESRLNSMSELLKDNAATFNKMRSRCASFSDYATEIDNLKLQLKTAQSQIDALTKERDSLLSGAVDPDNRIKEAVQRQDRAIAIAKLMAQETAYLSAAKIPAEPPSGTEVNYQHYCKVKQQVTDLKARVDQLGDENTHLKDVNEKLHTMYADLSNNSKQLKESYLKESIEALGKRHLKQLTPLQLIFIQPTRVLDLDLDLDMMKSEMAHVLRDMQAKATNSRQASPIVQPARSPVVAPAKVPSPQLSFAKHTPKSPEVTVLAPKEAGDASKKDAWGTDWDVYDEILQEELPTPPMEPEAVPKPTLSVDVKVDLSKSKGAWDDDFDELLKEHT